jgi:histone deacetylase 6
LQILTHMKAKLAFIECENESLQEELRQLEAALSGKRDELASLKSTRDRLWQQQRQLKEDSVFVTKPMLLQDIQVGGC